MTRMFGYSRIFKLYYMFRRFSRALAECPTFISSVLPQKLQEMCLILHKIKFPQKERKNDNTVTVYLFLFHRKNYLKLYIIKEKSVSLPTVSFGISFFLTNGQSSWAIDLFHLLQQPITQCPKKLVSSTVTLSLENQCGVYNLLIDILIAM